MKSIFKKIALVMALALIVTAFPVMNASAAEDPQVTPSITYYLGKTETAKLKTWNRAGMSWTFDVADESIATVDAKGYVTGLKVGTTEVTCTFTSKATGDVVATKTATVKVRRNADYIALGTTGLKELNIENGVSGEMEIGKGVNILPYVVRTTGAPYVQGYKADGYVQAWGDNRSKISDNVFITSSDESVIKVNDGTITAVDEGTAKITIEAKTWAKGETTAKVEYTINVKKTEEEVEVFDAAQLVIDQKVLDEGLTADGKSGTVIIFKLLKGEELNKEAKDVQVMFTTTRGSVGQDLVTLQNGIAYVLFQSEISTVELTAKISATVVSAHQDYKNLVGIQAASKEIKLVPAKATAPTEDGTGAKVSAAVVEYADRITLYFNKPVSAESLKNHYNLAIKDDVNNDENTVDFTQANVINMVKKADDAITFILNNDRVFTDNSKFHLEFTDNRYASAPVSSTIANGVVTEITKPALLTVTAVNLKQIMIKFSEPMDPETVTASAIAIDGVRLDGAIAGNNWGVAGSRATVAMSDATTTTTPIGKAVYEDGTVVADVTKTSKDTFIITLGKDANGKQIYIGAGTHVLTIYNAADFAARTDATIGNKIINSSLNFAVTGNDLVPNFDVVAQSPEQYKVTFNCAVETVSNTASLDGNSGTALLKLQYQKADGSWASVAGMESGAQDYEVVKLDERNYLIEVKKDWSNEDVFVGDADKNNYYNYNFKVVLAKDSVYNISNGKQNADCTAMIDDALMKDIDVDAPTCDISWAQSTVANATNGTFTLKFNEPIQGVFANGSVLGNAGNITPATVQGALPGNVSAINAQIYEVNRSKKETWNATVSGIDRENKVLTITAPSLTAGKTYDLVVRGVSDDIGNTANYKYTFSVTGGTTTAGPDEFYIKGVFADKDYDVRGVASLDNTNGNVQAIYVYFSTNFKTADTLGRTVLTNTNWTINGVTLPNDATIVAGVLGGDKVINFTGGTETLDATKGVTILLPAGTINDINFTVVALSKNVISDKDVVLTRENRVVTQYQYK